jgi:hypothetical protein
MKASHSRLILPLPDCPTVLWLYGLVDLRVGQVRRNGSKGSDSIHPGHPSRNGVTKGRSDDNGEISSRI